MKKTLVLLAFATVCLCATVNAQFNFGVSPGFNLSNSHIGYRFGKFEPTVSFAFIKGNYKTVTEGQRFDSNGNLVNYTETSSGKGGLYLPGIGLKYFCKSTGKITSYFSLTLIKPILSASAETDGINDQQVEDEVKKLRLFGAQLGYGVEYFFDPNFSVGGEFGLLFVKARYKSTDTVEKFDPVNGQFVDTQEKTDDKFVLNPTYATISLNFYFSKQAE